MKSKLFSAFDPNRKGNDDFFGDMEYLASLTTSQLDKCIEYLIPFQSTASADERDELLNRISAELNVDRKAFVGSFNVLLYIFRSLSAEKDYFEDTGENLFFDLCTLNLIPEDKKELFLQFLNNLVMLAESEGREFYAKKRAEIGLLPVIKGIGASVELRAVRSNSFSLGSDPSEYEPNIIGVEGIATFSIRTDIDEESLRFQATSKQIDTLIGRLIATKKELDALKVFVGKG